MTGIGDLQAMFTATQKTDAGEDVSGTARQPRASSGVTDRALSGVDKSVVSSAGGTLLAALGQSDVRADKVAKLQAAIADGSYRVSSSDVADSLIRSMLDGKR